MRKTLTFILILFLLQTGFAQVPSSCFEIESILVDACGPSADEADNEMVRIVVGPSPISLSTISVLWPNGAPFLGLCNTGTAAKVAIMNSTITSCGYILEPVGGILPAGAKVIFVTSDAMDPNAHSFANLTDTVYMIFQCDGSLTPHFRNFSVGVGPRTLDIQFGACAETVTYYPDQLVTPSGTPGAADGGLANFTWGGTVSYSNFNCQAPFVPLSAQAVANPSTNICAGDVINLTATISASNYTGFFWSGGAGSYSNNTSLITTYQTDNLYAGNDQLSFGLINYCGDTTYTHITLQITSGNSVSITASGSTSFCEGSNVSLTAAGAGTFLWSTGSTSNSITVDTTGVYSVTATNLCGSSSASQSITEIPNTPVTISSVGSTTFCNGSSVTLYATGGGPYAWSTGVATDTIVVTNAGNVSVTGNPVCGTANAQQSIIVIEPPLAVINGNPIICPGNPSVLTASGGDTYLWSPGETRAEISINDEGVYTVTVTNLCGADTETIELVASTLTVSFITDTTSGAAPLPISFGSISIGAVSYHWDFDDGATSYEPNPLHTFTSGGLYTVVLTVEDQFGCTATYSEELDIIDVTMIYAPSAFTPNGDGLNDLFIIKGAGITAITATIFNRWGQPVNTIEKNKSAWDGNDLNQHPEPGGLYAYLAYISLTNGETKKLRGSVLLVR